MKINVKTQAASLPDAPELSFDVPNEDIHLGVTHRASGVDTYEPGPFERAPGHDGRDFRWVLDFEGRELHNHKLPVRGSTIKRSVFVYNGLFYTLDTEEVIIRRPIQDASSTADCVSLAPQIQSGRICKNIGCDIYLSEQEEFLLKYGPDASYSVRLKKEDCLSYKISVTNLCDQVVAQTPPDSSDFDFYYDVLEVPEDERFKILSALGSADDTNPCNPGRVSITNAILR